MKKLDRKLLLRLENQERESFEEQLKNKLMLWEATLELDEALGRYANKDEIGQFIDYLIQRTKKLKRDIRDNLYEEAMRFIRVNKI